MSLPQTTPQAMPSKPQPAIRIFLDAQQQLQVSEHERHIHRNEEVVWQCDQEFCVSFHPEDCPFGNSQFTRRSNSSGKAKPGVAAKSYKYTVTAFGKALDPSIIID